MSEIREFLQDHLAHIFAYDTEHYRATTSPDLCLYEWYIVPQRIDGFPFHEFLMKEAQRAGAVPLVGDTLKDRPPPAEPPHVRFDLSNYREQVYGDTAICSYTLLTSIGTGSGVKVQSYNESRVIVKFPDGWRVVHVHKSPTYKSPIDPS
jgi:hypothetical protein